MKTVTLEIRGKVQGVFFRAKAKEIAESYGITGWIKNKKDGSVEALISGEDNLVEEFIKWCKHGPEKAQVENVAIKNSGLKKFDSFKVIR